MRRSKKPLWQSVAEFEVQGPLSSRQRPVKGGWSIGHSQTTAGTLGCLVCDRTDSHKVYILSSHQIARPNAKKGDPILQPGPIDGGHSPKDIIATLERRLQPDPNSEDNLDAAIAVVTDRSFVSPEIEGIGHLAGVAPAEPGMGVMKVGRTTGLTFGEIKKVDVSVRVNYGGGVVIPFTGVIQCDGMSAAGDTGAILMDEEKRAVGILFAGSEKMTLFLPIQRVLDGLNVSLITDQ